MYSLCFRLKTDLPSGDNLGEYCGDLLWCRNEGSIPFTRSTSPPFILNGLQL